MAELPTLKDAERARKQFSEELAKLGAHAIGVEKGNDGWSVVAHVEPSTAFQAPETLAVKHAGRVVAVPLVVQREDIAKPE